MIKETVQGLIDECKALFDDTGGTVLFHTQFKQDKIPGYTLPLIIIYIEDAPESGPFIGGVTRLDWNVVLRVYSLMPNPELDIDNGYSTSLLEIIDTVRRHFTKPKIYLTQSFQDIIENYNFLMELNGIANAEPLQKNNLIVYGNDINFSCVSIDTDTGNTEMSLVKLEHVYRIPDESSFITTESESPFAEISTLAMLKTAGSVSFNIVSNTSWIITKNQSWITADIYSGFGNQTITLTASANSKTASRVANITIKMPLSELDNKDIIVTQSDS
jgi:hypothetical protein